MMRQRHWFGKVMGAGVVVLAVVLLLGQSALAAGIRVVPSVSRVLPGEDFAIDIVAENIPVNDGLGAVQFRLNVAAPGAKVAGVPDLSQAAADSVALATPLLISAPTSSRSGLGAFFLPPTQGSGGILVMDNESLQSGSAQYTYAHTHGASRPSGTGSIARFQVRVGSAVAAEAITFTLTDVLLLDGGPAYPLDSNVGATVTLRCTSTVPALAGKSLAQAQAALAQAGLALGSVYEIDNLSGSQPLGVVLEQSAPAGAELDCDTTVNLAINSAPAEVTNLSAADRVGDDSGRVQLGWTASTSNDTAGYRVYLGSTRLLELNGAQTTTAEVGGLPVGVTQTLRVTAIDSHGNESAGATVTVTAVDDAPPQVTVSGVTDGAFYRETPVPQIVITEANPATQSVTLNGQPYIAGTPIIADGSYTLIVTVTDAAGQTVTVSRSFKLDRTAPVITINPPSAGSYYPEALTPVIAIDDANPAGALTAILLDGQPYQAGTPINGEGPHTLRVTAEDLAGNQASAQIDFILDLTAPTVTIDGITDGAVVKTDVTLILSLTDAYLADSSVTLNGAPYISGTPVTAEGDYLLTATASDLAGHATTLSVSFTLDKTAPVITLSEVADGAFYNRAVLPAITVSDLTLDAAQTAILLDGQPYLPGTSIAGEGAHVLAVSAVDRAGNTATLARSFTIDQTAPQITVTGVADGAYYNSDALPQVVITDAHLGESTLTLNGVAFVSGTPVVAEGHYALVASAVDLAGNQRELSLSFTIDKTAPISSHTLGTPRFQGEAALYVAGTTPLTLSAVDAGPAPSGIAGIGYSLDGAAGWTDYTQGFDLLALNEGPHHLMYRANDVAGNREADRSLAVIVDNSAPESSIAVAGARHEGAATLYVTGTTSFSLTAIDLFSGVALTEYRIDAGDWILSAPFVVSGEGEHAIAYRSRDHLGHQERAKTLAVTIDDTAPVTTLTVGMPQHTADGLTYVTTATPFTLTATDAASGVATTEYRIDGGEWQTYAPFALAAEGTHLVEYRSRDRLGNQETIQTLTVLVDNTPPTVAIAAGQPQFTDEHGLFITAATVFTVSAEDAQSGVAVMEYRIDEGPWTIFAPFTVVGEGAHTVAYRAADHLGNLAQAQTLAVTVDNTAPASTVTIGMPQISMAGTLYVTPATNVAISATDATGVSVMEYRFGEEGWTTTTGAVALTGLGDGAHQLRYRSRDYLGNQEAEQLMTLVIDSAAPISAIAVGSPQSTDAAGILYIAAETPVTVTAQDAGAGVAQIETRLDNGVWKPYAPLTIADEGPHTLTVRSTDALGNREVEHALGIIVDTRAPEADLTVGTPHVATDDGRLYITSATSLQVSSEDDWVGVAGTYYRLDEGTWLPAAAFAIASEGEHRLDYYGKDKLGHEGASLTQQVTVDNTAPTARISFSPQGVNIGAMLLLATTTEVVLTAEDGGVGVHANFYRLDDESAWRSYAGPFRLEGLEPGMHTLHFVSEDRLGNRAAEQSVTFTLAETTVDVAVLNLPRVLVWTEDPAAANGSNAPTYTLAEVRTLVSNAFGNADAYVQVVTDKAAFQAAFRSGLYNVVMILNQDVPFDAGFLRELREAVAQGHIGLLASSWGNNVHPILQDLFGLDFAGSMSMNEAQRPLALFNSEVSVRQDLTAIGRILKTRLAGGTLAGIVPGDSRCNGVRSVSFRYPVPVESGARVTVTAATQQGKKLTLVDEEQGSVATLPMGMVNTVTGNPAGDVAIDGATPDGVKFTLAAPYGSLGEDYQVTVKVEHADGRVTQSGAVVVTPTCAANLVPGVNVGPYQILSADVDQVKIGDDLPAVVLNRYGAGRTVFLAYNLLETALESGDPAHADLLGKAAGHLLPDAGEIEPAGIALVETTVSLAGTALDLSAVDTLDPALKHLPLFGLTQVPLVFRFHLIDGDTAAYRYFVRFPDRAGEYQKEAALSMDVGGGTIPYGSYTHIFALSTDSADLLQQAVFLVEDLEQSYPVSATSLAAIDAALKSIALLPKITANDYAAVIGATLQAINSVQALPFATDELQMVLGRYLRIMEAKQAMVDERE